MAGANKAEAMTISNIIQCLKEILPEENVAKSDITEPKAFWVQRVFSQLLNEFGINIENLHTDFDCPIAAPLQENFGIFQETLPVANLTEAMRYLLSLIEDTDYNFGVFDLINPKPKKTQSLLITLINLWQFCNVNFEEMTNIKTRVMERGGAQKKLEDDIRKIEKETESFRNARDKDIKNEHLQQKAIHELLEESSKVNEKLNKIKKVIGETTERLKNNKDRCAKLQEEKLQLENEEEALKVVTKELHSMQEKISKFEVLQSSLKTHMNSKIDVDKKSTETTNKRKELENVNALIKESTKLNEMIMEHCSTLKDIEMKHELLQGDVQRVESDIVKKKQSVDGQSVEITQYKKRSVKKQEALKAELAAYEAQIEKMNSVMTHDEIAAGKIKKRIKSAKGKAARLLEEQENQTCTLEQYYVQLLNGIKKRHEELSNRILDTATRCKNVDLPIPNIPIFSDSNKNSE